MTIFQNENVAVSVHESDGARHPYISFSDLTDKYNDTRGYTRNVRGLMRVAEFIKQLSTDERLKDDITFSDIVKILTDAKLRPHTYCGMD